MVSVSSWKLEAGPDTPFEHRLLTYFQLCVEAETEDGLWVTTHSPHALHITDGIAPLIGSAVLADSPRVVEWSTKRLVAGSAESVITGWPLVTATRPIRGDESRRLSAPLMFVRAEVRRDNAKSFRLSPTSTAIEVNPAALGLLGLAADERAGVVDLADDLRGTDPKHDALRLLRRLAEARLIPEIDLDPMSLGPVGKEDGMHNAAVAFVSAADQSAMTRALRNDLASLTLRPVDELRRGPLGALLAGGAAASVYPQPMPVATPTNFEQEESVASAMTNVLTVVTGPPGTGKTQVLVDAVAAAVCAGQSVLLASKNNHAIDVVAARIAALQEDAAVIRTGSSQMVLESAVPALSRFLARPVVTAGDADLARTRWDSARRESEPPYLAIAARRRLEDQVREAELELDQLLDRLPTALAKTDQSVDEQFVVVAHQAAVRLVHESESVKWPFKKQKRRKLKSELDDQVRKLGALLGPAAHDYLVDLQLREGPAAVLAAAADAVGVAAKRRALHDSVHALGVSPPDDDLCDAIDASLVGRENVGLELLTTTWRERLRAASPAARADAHAYVNAIEAGRARVGRPQFAKALPAFPAWCLTNLTAGTNLPLTAELFDFVVIDEASQSDLASAVPLLYRAKRAMIVGDPNQLTHITSTSERADEELAGRAGLTEAEVGPFQYKSTSLYARSAQASGREAIFLRRHFRSHPAIVDFVNQTVYGGKLACHTDASRLLDGPQILWRHVRCEWERGDKGTSVRKPVEADAVVDEVLRQWKELGPLGRSLGVISPFRAQVELVRERLAEHLDELMGLTDGTTNVADSVYGFQGDERDVMILSPTIGTDMSKFLLGFAGDKNAVNVAVTRARSRLIVVGDIDSALSSGTMLGTLAQYAIDRGVVDRT